MPPRFRRHERPLVRARNNNDHDNNDDVDYDSAAHYNDYNVDDIDDYDVDDYDIDDIDEHHYEHDPASVPLSAEGRVSRADRAVQGIATSQGPERQYEGQAHLEVDQR